MCKDKRRKEKRNKEKIKSIRQFEHLYRACHYIMYESTFSSIKADYRLSFHIITVSKIFLLMFWSSNRPHCLYIIFASLASFSISFVFLFVGKIKPANVSFSSKCSSKITTTKKTKEITFQNQCTDFPDIRPKLQIIKMPSKRNS